MNLRYPIALLPLVGAALLSSCAVYVPTVPSTPLLSEKDQVEITAGIRGMSSIETSAAWCPVPHLLLIGEAALQTNSGSKTRNNVTTDYNSVHRQASLGVGTYRLLGPDQSVYLGAVGGLGFASANIYDPNLTPIGLFSGPLVQYEARYRRYYGQLYVAKQLPAVSYGASLRGTYVDYSHLLRNGEAVAPVTNFYLEPTLFVRVGRRAVQGQATLGLSQPFHTDRSNPDNANLAPVNTLISASVVFRPHLLGHRE